MYNKCFPANTQIHSTPHPAFSASPLETKGCGGDPLRFPCITWNPVESTIHPSITHRPPIVHPSSVPIQLSLRFRVAHRLRLDVPNETSPMSVTRSHGPIHDTLNPTMP
jgi:hypothetical protein